MRREVTPEVVRHVDTSSLGEGIITYSQLSGVDVSNAIREQIDYFEAIVQDFEWKVFDYDRPLDLKRRLEAFGFKVGDAEAIMVLDLEHAPEALWYPVTHDVRRITDDGRLDHVQAIEEQVWDEDFSWIDDHLRCLLTEHTERVSVYIAYVNGQPASAAWAFFPEQSRYTSLWGGATIDAFRGQGLYTALLAVRAQEAKARGVRYLTVDASPMSRPILERFGFELLASSHPCKWVTSA